MSIVFGIFGGICALKWDLVVAVRKIRDKFAGNYVFCKLCFRIWEKWQGSV